jgi:hypothetical protein
VGRLDVASVVDRGQDVRRIRKWMGGEKGQGQRGQFQRRGAVQGRLIRLLRDTGDQLVQSRKQKFENGGRVRLFVAENQFDSRRVSLEGTTRYR